MVIKYYLGLGQETNVCTVSYYVLINIFLSYCYTDTIDIIVMLGPLIVSALYPMCL